MTYLVWLRASIPMRDWSYSYKFIKKTNYRQLSVVVLKIINISGFFENSCEQINCTNYKWLQNKHFNFCVG